jgi:hypothetical protein
LPGWFHNQLSRNPADFERYGNIYFAKDWFPGCERAEVCSDVPAKLKSEIEEQYIIGPSVEHSLWREEPASMSIDRGPCK